MIELLFNKRKTKGPVGLQAMCELCETEVHWSSVRKLSTNVGQFSPNQSGMN